MANTTTTTSCELCIESFNNGYRKEVSCTICNYKVCVKCCQEYLLQTTQPAHCMNCRHSWSYEFITTHFTKKFLNEKYKEHQKNILIAHEKQLLPFHAVVLDRINKGHEMTNDIEFWQDQVAIKTEELNMLTRKVYNLKQRQDILLHGSDPDDPDNKDKMKTAVFRKPCPVTDCNGFLDTNYTCIICKTDICSKCHEIKKTSDTENHTCKEENVATVKLKKRECKNCPKCGAEVSKEAGCDQMWCTVETCHAVFDWKTGEEQKNVKIHNPHYYEYLRRTTGSVPRDPDDLLPGQQQQLQCNNPDTIFRSLVQISVQSSNRAFVRNHYQNNVEPLMDIFRLTRHIEEVEFPRYTSVVANKTNQDIAIKYIRKEITEGEWKKLLFNRDKMRQKKDELLPIFQMIVQTSRDILLQFIVHWTKEARDAPPKQKVDIQNAIADKTLSELEVVKNIANEAFMKFAELYKCKAPKIVFGDKKKHDEFWVLQRLGSACK